MPVSPDSDKTPPAQSDHHAAMCTAFHWQVPERFNMAQVCGARWAVNSEQIDEKRIAIIDHSTLGEATFYTYFELWEAAGRLSKVLAGRGVKPGDRVAHHRRAGNARRRQHPV